MNVWKLMQDRLDVARETLADPEEDLDNVDAAGSEAATVYYAINGPCDGPVR